MGYLDAMLGLASSFHLASLQSRETTPEFAAKMLDFLRQSRFDEIAFFVRTSTGMVKKSFFRSGDTPESQTVIVTPENELNLHRLLQGEHTVTKHGFRISRVPVPGVGADFAIEVADGVWITGDNYEAAEDIEMYETTIEHLGRMFQQVISLERANIKLSTDALTGAFNRRAWEIATVVDGTLLALDIDHFKEVNDRYGHGVGDIVLRAVVGTMQAAIRRGDLCYRTGGEEFIIHIPASTTFRYATAIAEKVRRIVERTPILLPDDASTVLYKTISIGAAPVIGEDKLSAYNQADYALYEAK